MAQTEEVKVLGMWPSSYAMRPRIALNLKGVKHDYIEETMFPKSQLLLESNPAYKKIPVFFHNGVPICESLVILEYIDETWTSSHSLLPSDPYYRALARFWASFIDQKWYPSLRKIPTASTEEELSAAKEEIMTGTELLEEAFGICSKGGRWFGGEEIGYLDIAMGCFLALIKATDEIFGVRILDGERFPRLTAWADGFCAEEAVKDVMPETKKMVDFAKGMVASFKVRSAAS